MSAAVRVIYTREPSFLSSSSVCYHPSKFTGRALLQRSLADGHLLAVAWRAQRESLRGKQAAERGGRAAPRALRGRDVPRGGRPARTSAPLPRRLLHRLQQPAAACSPLATRTRPLHPRTLRRAMRAPARGRRETRARRAAEAQGHRSRNCARRSCARAAFRARSTRPS